VWAHLAPLHARKACRTYLDGCERFRFAHDHIPSFAEVNARLGPLEGFTLAPVAGLVTPRLFLEQLGKRRFLATQYLRHHSEPLYTPEPDVIHEYVGHVPVLAHPDLAALNLAFGHAAARADDPRRLEAIIRVYWYTLEFGVARGAQGLEVYGAGLLSSFGELGRFEAEVELRPFDLEAIRQQPFDPTDYQRVLFVAPSVEQALEELRGWLSSF